MEHCSRKMHMDKEVKEACRNFDNDFEEALSELFASEITEADIDEEFGPTALGHYLKERLRDN